MRNRLSKDVLEKLGYAKTNNGQFTKQMPLLKAMRESEEIESNNGGGDSTSNEWGTRIEEWRGGAS